MPADSRLYRSIFRLALPILAGQLGNIVVGFADNIMVGRYSTEALASAAFVNNVFNVALLCIMGFTYGLTPLIGAMYARGENDGIGRTLRRGLRVNIIFTLLIMSVMGVLYFYIDRLGQPQHLLSIIRPYYLIYLAGLLPASLFNVFAQWSYAVGNTRLPTYIILSANVLNIIGNYILIYGHFGAPEMGLTGAGISTLIARSLCPLAIMAAFFFVKSNRRYHAGFSGRAKAEAPSTGKIIVTSFPVAMQMSFETAAFSGAAVMAGWIGTVELAAFQIIVITGTLGFCVYYSFGAATAVMVSHRAGLSDRAGMRRVAWAGYRVLLCVMTLSCLTFIFFGRPVMGAFSSDPAVVSMAAGLLMPLLLYQVADATQINFANALRGTAHVLPMLYIALGSYIIVGLPSTYLLGFTCGLGIYGIVLSFSVSLILAAVLFLFFFLRATRSPR